MSESSRECLLSVNGFQAPPLKIKTGVSCLTAFHFLFHWTWNGCHMVFSPCIQQRFIDELEKALDVFRVSAAKHTHEEFHMVGLYAGGDYRFVTDTTATTME